ncbi:MAG: phosphoglucomutase, alpha-D-glucose phosphate-specific, partial [Arthrobacter sp.]
MAETRAGTTALPQDLIDVDAVRSAYFDRIPDPQDPAQRVAFGTSGHRGRSLEGSFNERHILAITQAIVAYPAAPGHNGAVLRGGAGNH